MNQELKERAKSGLGCAALILIMFCVAIIVAATIAVSLFFGVAWGMTFLAGVLTVLAILFLVRIRIEAKELSDFTDDDAEVG